MKEIRMVDLKTQYDVLKPEISKAIEGVLENTSFINGPQVAKFENELADYLGVPYVISCANGTDALQIALMALGLQPGDEVITPDFTFVSTIEVIALLGLTPVIMDVDADTFTIDPACFEKAITGKTRAVIPVHLFGQCAGMNDIMKIAARHGIVVIEDTAQAMGADFYRSPEHILKAGTIGHVGCTSFFPSKNLACYGDGGALFSGDKNLAEKCRIIANHGMKTKYYHDMIGVNSRLDTIQAAILSIKLKNLDAYIQARQRTAAFYDAALSDIPKISIPVRARYSSHVFHQYTVKLNVPEREELQHDLRLKGIPTMIYYPVPLHRQKAFSYLGCRDEDFPVTEELCRSVLSLPMHTELDDEQLTFITNTVKDYLTGTS